MAPAALDPSLVERAAAALRACFDDDAGTLFVTAGAGMGVDSGLPDFRGPEGFWRAYPAYRHLGLRFEDLANPVWFSRDPARAWGFYGHRRNLYRKTTPHAGYDVLAAFARRARCFVFTSNVDGAFDKAGFDRDAIVEVHGAIEVQQCTEGRHGLWDAEPGDIAVDETTFRAAPPFPLCPTCGSIARPNILMFGDGDFDDDRTAAQQRRFDAFLRSTPRDAPVVVVECGAGKVIPTVRLFSEGLLRRHPRAVLVRINAREAEADHDAVAPRVISIAAGARDALTAIAARC